MEAVSVSKVSPFASLQSGSRGQIATRTERFARRPLSSFLCGGCLKAQKALGRLPWIRQANSQSSFQKRGAIQAASVLSKERGGEKIQGPPLGTIIPVLHDERVEAVHNKEDFDRVLRDAKDRLVVVEYGTSESASVQQLHPALVSLAATCPDVKFALVLGDESDETEALMDDANIQTVPHFIFYKNGQKIHEESTIDQETITGDVLYYGDTDSGVVDIRSRADMEKLLDSAGDKLVVLDIGLKWCGPCVKVYPTVVKLARKMAGFAIFARVMGDENDWCEQLLKRNSILEVPTFVFLKNRRQQSRYVGSARGSLIGEILKLQGACQ